MNPADPEDGSLHHGSLHHGSRHHGSRDERILIQGLRLWAHVGVLEPERRCGQWFELDLELVVDLGAAGRSDDLADTLDYSTLIAALMDQARTIRCRTLEHYSDRILALIAQRHGPVPLSLELRKCAAPVPGFTGMVAVRRRRHGPQGGQARLED